MANYKEVTELHSMGRHAVCFIDLENYIYIKLRTRNIEHNQKIQCLHCNAVGNLHDSRLYLNVNHNHVADLSEACVRRFKHRMRMHAIEDRLTLAAAYVLESNVVPDEVILPTEYSLKTNFYRIRHQQRPPFPITVEDTIQRALSDKYYVRGTRFFQTHINNRGKYTLIFLSPGHITRSLESAEVVFIDGTFKIVPVLFKQLVSIHFKVLDEIIPGAYFLMQDKSLDSYCEAFRQLKLLIPGFNPGLMKSDFESGLTAAFRQVFHNCQLSGCWFHFTQCIWRKLGSYGMQRQYRVNPQIREITKMLFSIPLLPAANMIEAKDEILSKIAEFPNGQEKTNLFTIMEYFNNFWISTVEKRQQLSVFRNRDRTNNMVEGFHSLLKKRFDIHPNFYKFLDNLISIDKISNKRIIQYTSTLESWKPPRKAKWDAQDKRIKDLEDKLTREVDPISVLDFLRAACHVTPYFGVQNVNVQNNENDNEVAVLNEIGLHNDGEAGENIMIQDIEAQGGADYDSDFQGDDFDNQNFDMIQHIEDQSGVAGVDCNNNEVQKDHTNIEIVELDHFDVYDIGLQSPAHFDSHVEDQYGMDCNNNEVLKDHTNIEIGQSDKDQDGVILDGVTPERPAYYASLSKWGKRRFKEKEKNILNQKFKCPNVISAMIPDDLISGLRTSGNATHSQRVKTNNDVLSPQFSEAGPLRVKNLSRNSKMRQKQKAKKNNAVKAHNDLQEDQEDPDNMLQTFWTVLTYDDINYPLPIKYEYLRVIAKKFLENKTEK